MSNTKENTNNSLVKLLIDKETEKQMLKDDKVLKSVEKVFKAVGSLQDKIDETLKK